MSDPARHTVKQPEKIGVSSGFKPRSGQDLRGASTGFPATTGGIKARLFSPPWYPIIWEEMIYWRSKFWLYLATYMLSPML
ncbi:MAG: hypothetical protein ACPLUI_04020, partial [Desulfofundulus sp.]